MKQKLLVLLALTAFSVNLFGGNAPKFTISSEKYPQFLQMVDTSIWLVTNNGEVEQYTRGGKLLKSLTYKTESFDGYVTCLYVDANNHIWIGSDYGLAIYDGNSWQYHTEAVGNAKINVIQPVGSAVWIGTNNGVFKFTGYEPALNINALIPTGVSKNIVALCAASNGDIWFSAKDYSTGGLLRYRNEQIVFYNETKGLLDPRINTLIEGASGDIWAASDYSGVFRWRASEDTIYNYTEAKGLDDDYVSGIVKDNSDTLWIATQSGLSKFVADADTMISYNAENSNINTNLRPTQIVMLGDSIVVADNEGFSIFDRTGFHSFDSTITAGSNAKLVTGNNYLFYLSSFGTAVYYQNKISPFIIGTIGSSCYSAAQAPDGSYWYNGSVLTMQDTLGLWHITPRIYGYKTFSVKKIFFNPNGDVWITTDRGIARYRNNVWDTLIQSELAQLRDVTINDISFLDENTFCIATDEGLHVFDNGNYVLYSTDNGLWGNEIRKVAYAPDNSIWVSTYNTDEFEYRICHLKSALCEIISPENAFNIKSCSSIAFDSKGNPWFSAVNGDTKLISVIEGKWLNYTDSLDGNEGVLGIVFNSEGVLWCAGDYPKAVYSFDGNQFTTYKEKIFQDVGYFSGISLTENDNLLVPTLRDGVITIDKPISLSFTADTVCVGLKTLLASSTEPQVTAYKWELVDGDAKTQIGTDPTITYDFKGNGHYTVMLTVYDGVDSNWVSQTIDRNLIQPYSEQLKLVTAAESNDKMIVAWEKTPDKGTAYYNIYRLEADGFVPVGKTMYDQPSYFLDTEANFRERAYTYKITTVDNCGTESDIEKSNEHTSIHVLKIPYGQDFQLLWSKYIGVANPKYIVYETSKTGADTVRRATLPSINNSYTVLKYDSNKKYRIAIDLGYTVDPSKTGLKSDSGPYSQSLSNLAESIALEGVMLSNGFNAIVYPVPATDFCTVSVDETEPADYTVTLTDADGTTVYARNICRVSSLEETIPLKNIARGTYVLTIRSPKGTNSTTVIVQ